MDADGVDFEPALRRLYGEGELNARITKLKGDASSRSYYRIAIGGNASPSHPRGPSSVVAMRLPEDALRSDEAAGSERPRELPFSEVQRILRARGVPVPEILVDDTEGRVLLLEDLGDETFADRLYATPKERWPQLYGEAVDLLARLHAACAGAQRSDGLPFSRSFERSLLRWELDHFREWGLEALVGALPATERAELDRAFDALTDELLAIETGFVHRDYQSRNLMWAPQRGLVVIDFQDALQGPRPYDLVALLCDSYVALDPALQRAMIERYVHARGWPSSELPAFERSFWTVAVQRKLKDAGRFVFIDRVRGNPDFLPFFPQSVVYAGRALRWLGRDALLERIAGLLPGFPDAMGVPAAHTGRQ
jgi:aminoglycoside/choline kinase family phosphotransferase